MTRLKMHGGYTARRGWTNGAPDSTIEVEWWTCNHKNTRYSLEAIPVQCPTCAAMSDYQLEEFVKQKGLPTIFDV